MFLGHEGLEVGGGDVIGPGLTLGPFHEEAVGHAAIDAQDQHAFVALDAAAVVVVGDIQPLVKTAFDSPALAVEAQPALGIESFGRGTGDQGHFFVLAAGGLAEQSSGLHRQGKTDVFSRHGSGRDDAVFVTSLVALLGAGLRGCRLRRGENPLGERLLFSGC